jgi:hypothetical protein
VAWAQWSTTFHGGSTARRVRSAARARARARAVRQRKIAFDPFHVVRLANEAVQEVRRTEARERKGSAEATVFKGSRWALLKAPENLRDEEQVRLSEVAALNAELGSMRSLPAEGRAADALPRGCRGFRSRPRPVAPSPG